MSKDREKRRALFCTGRARRQRTSADGTGWADLEWILPFAFARTHPGRRGKGDGDFYPERPPQVLFCGCHPVME
jgi:hypothetical protein